MSRALSVDGLKSKRGAVGGSKVQRFRGAEEYGMRFHSAPLHPRPTLNLSCYDYPIFHLRRAFSMEHRTLFTSESVTEGHPDKIADQISDAILDAVLAEDPVGRVACETLVTTGLAMISGEITTKTYVDFPSIVRNTIREIGYTRAKYGFDSETCAVISSIDPQSPDIAQGVDTGGAGDQGLMFGFAVRETPELMPLPITLAHKLVRKLTDTRKSGELDFLRPDGKSQVTIEYDGKRPIRASAIVISTQHSPNVSNADLREAIIDQGIKPAVPA